MDAGEGLALLAVDEIEGGVRVTLSDGEILELAADSLPPALPAPGEVLPPPTLALLRDAAARKRIARRLFALLARRLQPRRALRRKLLEEGFPADALDMVLDRFAEEGVHSDRLYAEAWCRDTVRLRPVGRRYLEGKLRERGVGSDLAAAVARETLPDADERRLCREAARKWWRRQPGAADLRALSRGERYLMGRGFPIHVGGDIIRETAPEAEEAT